MDINTTQELLNLQMENANLKSEIVRKGNIIVALLEIIASTGNEELINKTMAKIGQNRVMGGE